jgi:hypothetical protein
MKQAQNNQKTIKKSVRAMDFKNLQKKICEPKEADRMDER